MAMKMEKETFGIATTLRICNKHDKACTKMIFYDEMYEPY
jgi:hypothetical protein